MKLIQPFRNRRDVLYLVHEEPTKESENGIYIVKPKDNSYRAIWAVVWDVPLKLMSTSDGYTKEEVDKIISTIKDYQKENDKLLENIKLEISKLNSKKADRTELANVVAGLVPMGSVTNLAELETKPKRNNDAYYVEDQLSPEGNAYIYRWDAGLNQWVNTKQVVFKDVITQGLGDSSNKAMSQKAVTDELATKANEADLVQLESDVEQLAYVKIKNEAVNGNLENGLKAPFNNIDGHGGASTLDINSSAPISGNYDIRLTITTPASVVGRPILYGLHGGANIGDKIYIHFYAKILSGIPTIRAISDGVSLNVSYGGDVIDGRNTRIIDVTGTSSNIGLIYFNSLSAWDMQMDNFMRINLTETFGAGKEPTEEEMNLLLDMLPVDYFEDEYVVPQEIIFKWQLALIRKNKTDSLNINGSQIIDNSIDKIKINTDILNAKTAEGEVWEDCIEELYINVKYFDTVTTKAILRSVSNSLYIWGMTTDNDTTWRSVMSLTPYTNGQIIPIICTTAYNGVDIGETMGYVIFNNIELFKSTPYSGNDNDIKLANVNDISRQNKINAHIIWLKANNDDFTISNNITLNNQEKINETVEYSINDDTSVISNTFIPLNGVTFENYYDRSSFSGFGQYIGNISTFRILFTKVRCANWSDNTTPVTQILVQFRQDTYDGTILKSKLFTLIKPILPGILEDVILDFEEDITITGNVFMEIRMNAKSTLMRASSTTYPYTIVGEYFTNGNIIPSNTGSVNAVESYDSLFWRLYSSVDLKLQFTNERITELETRLNFQTEVIDISLPDKIYAIVGDTIQLFYGGMIKSLNIYNYQILITCSKGTQYRRYFEFTPTLNDVGSTPFKIEIKDKDGIILGSKTCTLVTASSPVSPQTNINIASFGDSLTAGGVWCREADRRLTGIGGTPVGAELNNITFVGSLDNNGTHYHGGSGWTWTDYTTAGSLAFRFILTNPLSSVAMGNIYSNNTHRYKVIEINEGTILCSVIYDGTPNEIDYAEHYAPQPNGILTKTYGSGDLTVEYDSFSIDSANPLWDYDENKMTFVNYSNMYANGVIDVVYVFLTWNRPLGSWRTDFTVMTDELKKFADTLHLEFPNAKLKVMGVQLPSLKLMMPTYGAAGTGYSDTYGLLVSAFNMQKAYQDFCNQSEYSAFCEFVSVACQFDSDYNMTYVEKKVNTRNSLTEAYSNNGVHPQESGYMQIADAVYRNIVANFCQG